MALALSLPPTPEREVLLAITYFVVVCSISVQGLTIQRVVQRSDDREETVRHRLTVYRETTEPLVRYYQERGLPVHDVAGDRPIDEVQTEILERVGR